MASTFPTTPATMVAVPLDRVYVPVNVRDLGPGHLDALAGLIALPAVLVPVLITVAQGEIAGQGFQYELVAGFHRYAAVLKLQHTAIDAVVLERDHHSEGAEVASARAIDNVTRKQLNAYEEPLALQAMAARGLTEDGAAQALGWPKARVSARIKLLELQAGAQKLIGDGVIPLSCVAKLQEVGKTSLEILAEVLTYIAGGGEWNLGRLQSEIGWVIGRGAEEVGRQGVFRLPHAPEQERGGRADARQERQRATRGDRAGAQDGQPPHLQPAADPLQRAGCQPAPRGRGVDRERACAGDRRPFAVPRARQAGARTHGRGAAPAGRTTHPAAQDQTTARRRCWC